MHRFSVVSLLCASALFLAACDTRTPQNPPQDAASSSASKTSATTEVPAGVRTLEWDELMPADFDPNKALKGLDASALTDSAPRAQEMMAKLRKLWDEAPVVEALDGLIVRLPGFVVPLQADSQGTYQFLLVPYYGACIHVPPPPANQTVLVEAPKGTEIRRAFDTVWVIGKLSARRTETEMAKVGYTLAATDIKPYTLENNNSR